MSDTEQPSRRDVLLWERDALVNERHRLNSLLREVSEELDDIVRELHAQESAE